MKVVSVFTACLLAGVALAAPPEKVAVCHYGEEDVLDENGDVVLDENGNVMTVETAKVISISSRAVDKHLENHGDFIIETVEDLELCVVDMGDEEPV